MLKIIRLFAVLCATATPGISADLAGKWTTEFESPIGKQKYAYEFRSEGGTLSGKATYEHAMGKGESPIKEIKVKNDDVSFVETITIQDREITVTYSGKISGDEMKLARTVGDFGTEQLVAKRVSSWTASAPEIPDGWSESFIYANGIRIHYYHAVPAPGKPVIVAVHGVMDTGLTWASVVKKLERSYDVYMVDTRGHGLSDPFNGSEDGKILIKDVVAFVNAMGFEKPILMGHSMGAATVMHVGAEHPGLARAIIMLDPALGGRGGPSRRAAPPPAPVATAIPPGPREVADPTKIQIDMRGSPEALVAQNNYRFEDLVAKARSNFPKWSLTDCQYWAVAIKRYHGPYSDGIWQAMFGVMKTEDALAKIQVPALILKADAPPDVRQTNQEAAKVMQHGRLVHIDGTAHNLHRDDPERTFEALTAFLSTL